MFYKPIRIGVATFAALLLAAGLAAAKTRDVDIDQQCKLVNGTVLEPGTYMVKLLGESNHPDAAFYKDGKLVARVPAQLQDVPKKAPYTELYYNRAQQPPRITGIELRGWTQKIILAGSADATHGGQ